MGTGRRANEGDGLTRLDVLLHEFFARHGLAEATNANQPAGSLGTGPVRMSTMSEPEGPGGVTPAGITGQIDGGEGHG
jgi:hypothetical protein